MLLQEFDAEEFGSGDSRLLVPCETLSSLSHSPDGAKWTAPAALQGIKGKILAPLMFWTARKQGKVGLLIQNVCFMLITHPPRGTGRVYYCCVLNVKLSNAICKAVDAPVLPLLPHRGQRSCTIYPLCAVSAPTAATPQPGLSHQDCDPCEVQFGGRSRQPCTAPYPTEHRFPDTVLASFFLNKRAPVFFFLWSLCLLPLSPAYE